MPRTRQCFRCSLFVKAEDCVLLRHKTSGIRRWFHKKAIKPECHDSVILKHWQEVDSSLGETTYEEERKLATGRGI